MTTQIAPASQAANPPAAERTGWLAVGSWALYDLANTIFSMNIVSLYFSLWVVNQMGGTDASYGFANSLSMLLVFFTAPLLGILSDWTGRRMPFLIVSTLTCVTFTALLGMGDLSSSLRYFIIANYMFQVGLIFYEPLLMSVSTEENRGRISGLGVGVGYFGSIIGVGSGLLFLDSIGYTGIFRLTAVVFLVFALPCFFFVRERKQQPLADAIALHHARSKVRLRLAALPARCAAALLRRRGALFAGPRLLRGRRQHGRRLHGHLRDERGWLYGF